MFSALLRNVITDVWVGAASTSPGMRTCIRQRDRLSNLLRGCLERLFHSFRRDAQTVS